MRLKMILKPSPMDFSTLSLESVTCFWELTAIAMEGKNKRPSGISCCTNNSSLGRSSNSNTVSKSVWSLEAVAGNNPKNQTVVVTENLPQNFVIYFAVQLWVLLYFTLGDQYPCILTHLWFFIRQLTLFETVWITEEQRICGLNTCFRVSMKENRGSNFETLSVFSPSPHTLCH